MHCRFDRVFRYNYDLSTGFRLFSLQEDHKMDIRNEKDRGCQAGKLKIRREQIVVKKFEKATLA